MTNEERLVEVRAVMAKLSDSILALAGKTNQSVSFGDQSYSIGDIQKLDSMRDKYRGEELVLLSRISGTKRRTIKIHF